MNLQRNILIGALLVITYLMVVQWNKDFVQQDLAPAAQTEVAPLDPTLPAASRSTFRQGWPQYSALLPPLPPSPCQLPHHELTCPSHTR